ncbi:hypothetical protein OIY81_550 [Cryptosporidium canis]|nr:hypothetical protein OIY81_550 [Cryptosporidium canis]
MEGQVSIISYVGLTLSIYLTLFISLIWTLLVHFVRFWLELLSGVWIMRRVFPFLEIIIQRFRRVLGLERVSVERKDLTGKICIVTGGADGIGKRVSEYFVQCGATVIIADIQENKGRVSAYKINTNNADSAGFARYMYIDLSDQGSIQSFVRRFT